MLRYSFLFLILSFSCAHAFDNDGAGSVSSDEQTTVAEQMLAEQKYTNALLKEIVCTLCDNRQAANKGFVYLAEKLEGLGERVGNLEKRVRSVEQNDTHAYEVSCQRGKKKKKRSGRQRGRDHGQTTVMHRRSPTFDLGGRSLTGAYEDNSVLYSQMLHDT